jgi:glycine C-acetyltransferase
MNNNMDYSKKSVLDYFAIEGNNVFQTADEFDKYVQWLYDNKQYYTRRISYSGSGPHMDVKHLYTGEVREMINFSGNEYLNLTKHPKTIQAGVDALNKYGIGAGSAPLLGGMMDVHVELEKRIAELKGCESAMIFSSGYGTNLGSLLAMLKENDLAMLDQYSHASIADGASRAVVRTFKHSDMNSLENILKINSRGKFNTKMICVDGVYSMDGDIAPLPRICEIAKRFGAFVFVDDAHATGVIGKNGKGTCEHFDMEGKVDIVAGTFSKAFGCVGGYIASTRKMVDYLRIYSRSYMFSTAMAPQAAASILAGIDVIMNEPDRRRRLWDNISYLKEKLISSGFNIGNTQSAIFPVIIGDVKKVSALVGYLDDNNIFVNSVSYPAVPVELSRIRIGVMQGHTKEDLDALVYHLEKKGKELQII